MTSPELSQLRSEIWISLERAASDLAHPYRFAALATVDAEGPHVRTILLRAVDTAAQRLVFYSDIRAAKIAQLQINPIAELAFYDPATRVQIQARGRVLVFHQTERNRLEWDAMTVRSRLNYCLQIAPGSSIDTPLAWLPNGVDPQQLTVAQTAGGYENFAMLELTVDRLEWLQLASEGNRRALFDPEGRWLVP